MNTTLMMTDLPAKHERIRRILDLHEASCLQLASAEALSWLLDGARVTVPIGGTPVLSARISRESVVVSVFANEIDRFVSEEFVNLNSLIEVRAIPWHEHLIEDVRGRDGILCETDVAAELRAARASLLPVERSRYGEFGHAAALAVTAVLAGVRPAMTEREVAAELARAVVGIGADPIVLLVAGASRLRVRHPLPSTAVLGGRAMVAVGARRSGTFISFTRWIEFAPDDAAAERDARLFEVEADAFDATIPGRPLHEVLGDIARSYVSHGFGSDAWLGHHQGGPTGYLARDPRAHPNETAVVESAQAFAWNPSVAEGKVEDTVIVDRGGVEVLSATPSWPTILVRGRARPAPLQLG